ncbi:hypothetical protein EDB89DRAFT_1900160 [Lactarius sanguifluus]|nr:hypothetical protein EDB89DRAFT_1900160 [Lactarius sanguifluus]
MPPSVYVFTPNYPNVSVLPFNENPAVATLLFSIWRNMSTKPPTVYISQLSPPLFVPKEPWDTLRKRIDDSARNNGWETVNAGKLVSPHWCDPGPDMRAAEKLHEKLWGVDYNVILEEISDGQGTTWKYFGESTKPPGRASITTIAKAHKCGGVVVTGQPGIGKSCFLYYLLFRLLSKKNPVALQRSGHFFVFQEDGVSRYPLTAYPDNLPAGTWALSDSNRTQLPCATFLEAASWGTAWIIQTTSPLEQRWQKWKTQRSADIFVMDYFPIEEMTVLGLVNLAPTWVSFSLNLFERWGPSARTCLRLSRNPPAEREYEKAAEGAAKRFVKDPDVERDDFDVTTITHILISVRPEEKDEAGRRIHIVDLASDRIKTIVSYAAANARARKRIEFLNIEATRWMNYFCRLHPKLLAAVDAIVFTDKFIITVQVAVSGKPSTKGSDLAWADIKKSIPRGIRGDRDWRHMYVTDSVYKAKFLQNQTSSDLPKDIRVYYEVFNVGRLDMTHQHLEAFDESGQCARRNSVDVDGNEVITLGNNF